MKALPRLTREYWRDRRVFLVLGIDVDGLVGHVQISAEDDRLLQRRQIVAERLFPREAVIQALQGGIGADARHIDVDDVEAHVFECDQAALAVAVLVPQLRLHRKRQLPCERQSAGVVVALRGVPKLDISRRAERALPLDLLQANDIRIGILEKFQKALALAGDEPVYVP